MKRWADRSRVEASLLNPALIALLMSEAAREYERQAEPMSWPLTFLVPPLVLHRPTRDALPRDTRTHLSTWIARQPVIRAGFPDRAVAMAPLPAGSPAIRAAERRAGRIGGNCSWSDESHGSAGGTSRPRE